VIHPTIIEEKRINADFLSIPTGGNGKLSPMESGPRRHEEAKLIRGEPEIVQTTTQKDRGTKSENRS